MKTWKIYKHTLLVDCEHTGWSYIGLTCQDVKDRWSNGKGYCNGNQKVFEAAIKKYGWGNFSHEILEDNIESLEEANKREQYWIEFYNSFLYSENPHGYNLTKGGDGVLGHKVSDETKKILAEASTGQISSRRKKVICIETQEIFESLLAAANAFNLQPGKISLCCTGKRQTNGGYHWAFADDTAQLSKYSGYIGQTPKNIKKSKPQQAVRCIELNLVFKTITDAAKAFNTTKHCIWNCISGRCKTSCGYHWERID